MKQSADASTRHLVLAAAAAALCLSFASSQERPQPPVMRVSNYSVAVDVVVTDGGNRYVTDLGKDDFTLLEDGVPQAIESIQSVFPGGEARPDPEQGNPDESKATALSSSTPLSPPHPNLVIMLLDYATVDYLNQKYVREAAVQYVRERMQSNDLMAVFQVGMGLRFLQGFTDNRDALVAALSGSESAGSSYSFDQAGLAAGADKAQDDATLLSSQIDSLRAAAGGQGNNVAQIIANLESQMERTQAIEGTYYAQLSYSREQQSRPIIGAIRTIADGVAHIPGRKTLVMFSEGFSVPLTLERPLYDAVARSNRSNLAIYAIDAGGLRVKPASLEPELHDISANRPGDRVKAYGGLSEFDRAREIGSDQKDSTLRYITTATGGFLIRHTNDFYGALKRVDEEIRSHYVLTYQPSNLHFEGEFRNIAVQVRRPGLKVRSRSGYWAVPPEASVLSADEYRRLVQLDKRHRENTDTPDAFPLFAQTSHFIDEDGDYDVQLTVEVPIAAGVVQNEGGRAFVHLQTLGLIQDESGNTVTSVRGPSRIRIDPEASGDSGYLRMETLVRLPAGRYSLLVECTDAVSGKASHQRLGLQLPEQKPGTALSSLVVGESIRATVPRDSQLFSVEDVRIFPSARRRFLSGDRIVYYLNIYRPGLEQESARLELTVSLFHRGRRIGGRSETLTGAAVAESPLLPKMKLARYLDLKGLRPGRYLLRADVLDKVRNQKLTTQTSFDIVRR